MGISESAAKCVLAVVGLGYTLVIVDAWARYRGWWGRDK